MSADIEIKTTMCRVCGTPGTLSYLWVRNQHLDRCPHCHYVQVREKPVDEVIRKIYSDNYFEHTKYKNPGALDLENKRRLNLLINSLEPGSIVWDAGCSTGDFIRIGKDHFRMYGTDLSDYAIELAKQKNPELADQLRSGRLEEARFSDLKFDAICLWDVIEHIWDPAEVIETLLSRLKPGGFLFLSTPAIDAITARVLGRYWAFMTPPEHLGFFTDKTFRWLFEKKFNADIRLSYCRGKWANAAFIAYKLKRIAPVWFPGWLLSPFQKAPLSGVNLYVPTKDVRYMAIQFNGN